MSFEGGQFLKCLPYTERSNNIPAMKTIENRMTGIEISPIRGLKFMRAVILIIPIHITETTAENDKANLRLRMIERFIIFSGKFFLLSGPYGTLNFFGKFFNI